MSWLQPRRLESSAQVDSGVQSGRRRGGGRVGAGGGMLDAHRAIDVLHQLRRLRHLRRNLRRKCEVSHASVHLHLRRRWGACGAAVGGAAAAEGKGPPRK